MTFDLDLWPFDRMSIRRFPDYMNKQSLVQIWLQLFKWGHFHIFSLFYNFASGDLWPWYMTFDHMNIWRFPYYINKPNLAHIGLQPFKWKNHFHIFSPPYNLTSNDIWPWYVTFDLINKWGFPCCIYDPTLVEIHWSMWKVEPNVNLFLQQEKKDNNNIGQSDPYVSFLLRQTTHKPKAVTLVQRYECAWENVRQLIFVGVSGIAKFWILNKIKKKCKFQNPKPV